ncbi:MAG: hypothetical protein CMH31_03945 [Micavibrio sp.]|nr:hypothetical protein [Micavibrio sp.]|tara:strand:- start:1278 stop:2429 length:1152 start_codon:yes stop_codon:yes gene_type:complete
MVSTLIINSDPKQLRLAENGDITWQKDVTNPLPGEKVAVITKGESVVSPQIILEDNALTQAEANNGLAEYVQNWLNFYVREGLEPLFRLQDEALTAEPVKNIAQKLFDGLGILPREELQADIDQMDDDMRQSLRPKKLRFGPLLVYLPELKKPAAVRMQALLLTLWNDKSLPAQVPADGIVSFSIKDKDIDADYYRAIGYPVYGPRAMRVDMLDRVVCAVYDSAKDGKFMAQHQMAEWLGSNIEDLYLILEAMGHKKISEPTLKEDEGEKTIEASGVKSDDKEVTEAEATDKVQEQAKPDLAIFALKRGKASQKSAIGGAVHNKKKDLSGFSSKPKKKFKPKGKRSNEHKEPRERVYKAEAKTNPEDNPFAILGQLKVANKDD